MFNSTVNKGIIFTSLVVFSSLLIYGFNNPSSQTFIIMVAVVFLTLTLLTLQLTSAIMMFKKDKEDALRLMKKCPYCEAPIYKSDTTCPYCKKAINKEN